MRVQNVRFEIQLTYNQRWRISIVVYSTHIIIPPLTFYFSQKCAVNNSPFFEKDDVQLFVGYSGLRDGAVERTCRSRESAMKM